MPRKQRIELRNDMRRVLSNLDQRWREVASHEISNTLDGMVEKEFGSSVQHVLAWVAFFPGEIDLSRFISLQLAHRAVYLPRVSPDRTMTFISIGAEWGKSIEEGYRGIPEPRLDAGAPYDPANAANTVVVVPGLAFDAQGNRLGRGGGYYDRFLAQPAFEGAATIGACWSLQLVNHVPTEAHDIAVDWVCHERGYIKTGTA